MSKIFYLLFTNKCIVFNIKRFFTHILPIYFMLPHGQTAASHPLTAQVLNQTTRATQLWLANQNRDESFHCWLFTAALVFFLSQEVPGGVLLHHHREEQPPYAACGPQLSSGRLYHHRHQPSGQLLPLRPLPAQEVSG